MPIVVSIFNMYRLFLLTSCLLLQAATIASLDDSYDVLVYDATSAGVMAAYAAARRGAKTALICASYPTCFEEGGKIIGGMSAGGLGQTDLGSCPQVIGGFAREFYRANRRHYGNTSEVDAGRRNDDIVADCRLPSSQCDVTYNLEPGVAQGIFNDLVRSAGVDVVYGRQVLSVAKSRNISHIGSHTNPDPVIERVIFTDGSSMTAKVFMDASYEGDLLAAAGVSYSLGREAASTYNETLAGMQSGAGRGNQFTVAVDPLDKAGHPLPLLQEAPLGNPGQGDHLIQAYNFRLCVTKDPTKRVPFAKPAGYDPSQWELLRRYLRACGYAGDLVQNSSARNLPECQIGFPSCNTAALPNGKYDMNNCGPVSSDFIGRSWDYPEANYTRRTAIWYEHRAYIEGLLWTLANDARVSQVVRDLMSPWGLCGDEFKASGHFPPTLYVREARRLRGDRVFTQNTPRQGSVGNLSIGLGCYNFDSHNAQRFVCKNRSRCFGAGPVDGTGPYAWVEGDVQTKPGIYEIPYWVMLPRRSEVANLLVVGSPSASHIGMSTLRMEPQFMILGHSAGVAASLAITSGTTVHDVNLDTLHAELMREGQILSAQMFSEDSTPSRISKLVFN